MKNLGKYEILKEIGRGGFAVVYEARDTTLDRIVALKVLHPHLTIDPKFVQRFHQEARAAAGFHHPHIVTIHEVGEEAGQHYLAMAYLSGWTLGRLLTGRELSVEEAISIVEQIAGALDTIHRKGLVHRDVKPGNIVVDESGQVTLLDFGIVRAAEGTRLTTAMSVLGTPEYMSPELAELDETMDIDWRADIYALGVVAYEMLVGTAPFTGKSPTAVLYKHVHEPPPSPTALRPDLSPGLEPVLLKALAKRREDRYQSAGEMARAFREAVPAAESAPLPEPRPAVQQPPRPLVLPMDRSMPWRWIAGVGLVAAALIVFVLVLTGGGGKDGEPTKKPATAAAVIPPPTDTRQITATPEPTDTVTRPTDTPEPANTATSQPTHTLTEITTRTPVPTSTTASTPTPTYTPTPTPSNTPTNAPTPTDTPTPSPTATNTPTPSPTATDTLTPPPVSTVSTVTMEPGTGFIFSLQRQTSGAGADRDIWWNGVELVPGDRMYSLGTIFDVEDIVQIATGHLEFAAFVPGSSEGFAVEIERGGEVNYAVLRVISVSGNRLITFEWLYPYTGQVTRPGR